MATGDFWQRLRRLFTPSRQPQQVQPRRQVPVQTPQVQPQPVAPQQGPLSVQQKLQVIAEAGRKRVLLLIKYDGVERFVEPYSMRMLSTGAHFYGFCSIHMKIHSFKPEKIEEIKLTEWPFSPRWPIEF